jgi:transposase-like protein
VTEKALLNLNLLGFMRLAPAIETSVAILKKSTALMSQRPRLAQSQTNSCLNLKPVYRAATKQEAEMAQDALEDKWGKQYPLVINSWRRKWQNLSVYFKYPDYIRKVIYTTNAIEAVHRQFRKLTKTKGGFTNENSLLKLLYAGILNASKKWTMPVQKWNLALSQLAIHFEGRLDKVLAI